MDKYDRKLDKRALRVFIDHINDLAENMPEKDFARVVCLHIRPTTTELIAKHNPHSD